MLVTVPVKFNKRSSNSYQISLGAELLHNYNDWLKEYFAKKIVIITDENVANIYAKHFIKKLKGDGYNTLLIIVKVGEESKSYKTKEYIDNEMLKNQCDRSTLIVALGGGVIGDLAGFVAATYMRGLKYIQVPTTLLAMIDSSIGGKTAINTLYGKNLIGAIWQPQQVVADLNLLKSLNKIQLINGLIEAIKIFLTLDAKSYHYVEKNITKILNYDAKSLLMVIKRAVRLKAFVVVNDEREENLRMILNFGHTIGHALERSCNYTILHGYCVGLGILVESKIAQLAGFLLEESYLQITRLFASIGVESRLLQQFDIKEVIANTYLDKKNKDGQIHCVLLAEIGKIYSIDDKVATIVTKKQLEAALEAIIIN